MKTTTSNLIFVSIFIPLLLFLMEPNISFATPDIVYKEARPKKFVQTAKAKPGKRTASGYFYDRKNKTDPFAPYIVKRRKNLIQFQKSGMSEELKRMLNVLKDMKAAKTELQRIKIASLKITAIIQINGKVMAMVKGPGQAKGFMIKKGTMIGTNGGEVEEIISEEKKTDMGKQLIRKIIIKEPYLGAKGKLQYKNVEMKMAGSIYE